MKTIRFLAVALMVLALGVTAALARNYLRERDDGRTEWRHSTGNAGNVVGRRSYTMRLADVSAEASERMVVPDAGTITQLRCILGAAITTADATVALGVGAANAFVNLTITQSGSATNDIDSDTPLAQDVIAGDFLVLGSNGQSDTTAVETCTIVIDTDSTQ